MTMRPLKRLKVIMKHNSVTFRGVKFRVLKKRMRQAFERAGWKVQGHNRNEKFEMDCCFQGEKS